jgi:predicted nucleotidyltransferase
MNDQSYGNESQIETKGASSPKTLISGVFGTKAVAMSATVSPRPALKSQQSTSLPTTPNQRPRDRASQSRSPSAKRNASNPSPRPHHSGSLPAPRKVTGGCKYETGMANAKRRVPYSLGPDKLDADPEVPKAFLRNTEDERLTSDMMELYTRLLPSQESEDRRRRLVEKLQSILRKQWPGHTITVNVFGSTGNKLGSTDSDVDICITTDHKALEQVCVLADFLAKQGMQRVVCISAAKVPIVKIWDPELRLACDMNVNNPVALENTDMIRAYVEIDERVRPLAMIIKHWTKRRVLNEAGRQFLRESAQVMLIVFSFGRDIELIYLDLHDHQLSPDPKSTNFACFATESLFGEETYVRFERRL